MSKELAYTKGELDIDFKFFKSEVIYQTFQDPRETESEAEGNCKLFNQAAIMYELFKQIDECGWAESGLRNRIKEIIKKIES